MRRSMTLLLALCLVGSVGAAPNGAPPPRPVSDLSGPLDTDADLAAMKRFEALIPEHTFYGMVTSLNFDAWPHLDPDAKPTRFDGEADSGNYTGEYLAAQSWRYTQAKQEIARLERPNGKVSRRDEEAHAFWIGQRDEAFARVDEMVRYYHLLVNIAQEWQTELDPQIDDSKNPDEIGWMDYGGGVIPGEPGLLMRACTPSDPSPAFADVRVNYTGHYRLLGPWPWEDGREWYCLGGTSRDSYAGTIFGMSVALDQITEDAPELRDSLARDLMAMTDYAVKYAWTQPRPHGDVANPAFGHNDLDGPVSPLFIQVPLHRLHLVQTARRAAEVLGDAESKQRYDVLWLEEIANTVATGSLIDSMVIDAAGPHDAHYKYQLHLVSFYNVIRLEPDPVIREELTRALGVLDASLTDDGNAFYEAIILGLTGEPERLAEAVDLHRQWLDYYAFHEEAARVGNVPFLHTGRCTITGDVGEDAPIQEQPLQCVPRDQVDMVQPLPTGDEVVTPFRPGTDSRLRALDPLPVGVRRYADFLWQKDPTIIDGDHATPWRGPSIDFLVTYWMLRYHSEVEIPTLDPLPEWLGPRFR